MNWTGWTMDWSVAAWVGMGLKGVVVLAGAGLVSVLLHRASASYRHLVWAVALVSLPLITLLSFLGPGWGWSVPVVPDGMTGLVVAPASVSESSVAEDVPVAVGSGPAAAVGVTDVPGGLGADPAVAGSRGLGVSPTVSWDVWLAGLWAVAAAVICLPLVVGAAYRVRICREARVVTEDDGWTGLVERSRRELQLRRHVELLEHDRQTMPMTWGTLHPTVMLPAESRGWSEEKRRAVLLHELAHVQRLDYLTRILARLGLALHLFNPLAWVAWHRMRIESERACDDRVLDAGANPAAYADQLIEVAQDHSSRFGAVSNAITMARRSQLEGRVLAILDVARERTGVGRTRLAWSLTLAALVLVPVSAIRLVAQGPDLQPVRKFVRVAVDGDSMRFEGERVDWEELAQRLATLPDRSHTVLELAFANEDIPLRQWNASRARVLQLSQLHGFEYFSEVGLHPVDSSGSPPEPTEVTETYLADQRDRVKQGGDLLPALRYEMRRVALRRESGHAYKDKISLDGVWENYRAFQRPDAEQIRRRMEEVEAWGQSAGADPELGWRMAHVLSVMAQEAGDFEVAMTWADRALDAYPVTAYAEPSKQSKFQHLVNHRAGLQWEAAGYEFAVRDALARFRTDPRFESFFLAWWVNEMERKGISEHIESLKNEVVQGYAERIQTFPDRANRTRGYMASLAPATDQASILDSAGDPVIEEPCPLQQLINEASPGDTVVVPDGTHSEPLVITKALTLRGSNSARAMLKVRADQPALEVRTDQPVVIEDLSIEWQRASSRQAERPLAAVFAGDGPLTIARCQFSGEAGYERCPSAVSVEGFADLELRDCMFDGFEYTVQLGGGAKGIVEDCILVKPGHCGLTAMSGAELTARRNLVTGSRFHGLRCTGGTLIAEDNLIIANKNRGIYLGNRAAHGRIENNLILGNATGISAFGGSDNTIRHNVFLNNTFAAIDSRSLCPITVEANVLQGNNQGFVVWKESESLTAIQFGENTFWKNASNDAVRIELHPASVMADPGFVDVARGDFNRPGVSGAGKEHGLLRPESLVPVWERWTAVSSLIAE